VLQGATLFAGDWRHLEASSTVVLALRDGGQATLHDAIVRLGTEAESELLLVRGGVHASLPPQGNSPRPPLRVATPSATAEIGASGEIWVVAFHSGGSWIVGLAGRTAVTAGDVDDERELVEQSLIPGRAVVASDRLYAPTPGPRRLDVARELTREMYTDDRAPAAQALERSVAASRQRLDEALGWLEAERTHGEELATRHRRALAQGSDEAAAISRELIGHSAALVRLRRLVLSRWELFEVGYAHLASSDPGDGPDPDPTPALRPRVRELLGLSHGS
jgi:hypothetical protein